MLVRKGEVELAKERMELNKKNKESLQKGIENLSKNHESFKNFTNKQNQDLETMKHEILETINTRTKNEKAKYIKEFNNKIEEKKVCFFAFSFLRSKISLDSNLSQTMLNTRRQERQNSFDQLQYQTEKKIYDMKITSMDYRSWTIDLYNDYCNSLFFNRFEECEKSTFLKSLTQDFQQVLMELGNTITKVIDAKKIIVHDAENRQYKPKSIRGFQFHIEDNDLAKPIEDLKTYG